MNRIQLVTIILALLMMTGFVSAQELTSFTSQSSQVENAVELEQSIGSGFFEFRSNVEGARVLLDGEEVGVITNGILEVSVPVFERPKTRHLMMQADGYSAYNETLIQSPKVGKTLIVRGTLQILPLNLTGTLNLAVSPPGAQVVIDDNPVGIVDQSGIFVLRSVKAGYRMVKVHMPGYEDSVQKVYVEANMVTKERLTLTPVTTGSIQITSSPAGAQVNLNGAPYGITPVTAQDIEQGSYRIDFVMAGYQPYQTQVLLNPGQVVPVNAQLQPVPTQVPTPNPTTIEPTPTPTQAGLSPLAGLVGIFAMAGFLRKRQS